MKLTCVCETMDVVCKKITAITVAAVEKLSDSEETNPVRHHFLFM